MTVQREVGFYDLMNMVWSGAVDTIDTIMRFEKEDELMDLLEEVFCDHIPSETEVNDLLWFEDKWIFESLGIEIEED